MKVTVAATQMSCTWDIEENLAKAEGIVRDAAAAGAQVVLPQEMFSSHFAFIAGPRAEICQRADDHSDMFVTHTFDLDEIREMRAGWGVFRDRRPDAYGPLLTLDGTTPGL